VQDDNVGAGSTSFPANRAGGIEFRFLDKKDWPDRGQARKQMLWTLIDEVPAKMGESDD
jgi:hypothetical protein